MRRTRRSGGRPPKKTSAEKINSAKRHIQRRRGTRVAHNAAERARERMAIAEEAARQQAIADAEAEAQRAAAEAQRAAQRLEELRRPLPLPASVLGMDPAAPKFVSQIHRSTLSARAPSFVSLAPTAMNEGFARQARFVNDLVGL